MSYGHEKTENKSNKGLYIFFGIGSVILILLLLSFTIVPAGSVGVITRFGAVNRVAPQGISAKIPLVEAVRLMSVRTQKDQVDASAASFNMQNVYSKIAVNYKLDYRYAHTIFAEVGKNYSELVVAPAIQEAYKAVTAKYTAEQLIQKRAEVSAQTEITLQESLNKYHVIIEAFNIIDFQFSKEYADAIEAKQVAEQQVQTSKLQLEKSRVEAQQRVVEAQAQADAQKALKDTGALSSEYLQYLFLTKWNGILPSVMGGASPIFDVTQFLNQGEK